jgi:hypothetical protein
VAQSLLSTAVGLESQVVQCQNACRSVMNFESANCRLKPVCNCAWRWVKRACVQEPQHAGCCTSAGAAAWMSLTTFAYGLLQHHNVLQHHMCTAWATLPLHLLSTPPPAPTQSAKGHKLQYVTSLYVIY